MSARFIGEIRRVLVPLASESSLAVEDIQVEALAAYGAMLLDENQRFNLTACRDASELVARHLCDAVVFAAAIRSASRIADVGSGGGLPGIPLAILLPAAHVTLVESVRKKARFLESVSALPAVAGRIAVVCERAEALGRLPAGRARFDAVVMRACAALPIGCEYGLPLVSTGGLMVAAKGPAAGAEIRAAARAIDTLGAVLESSRAYRLPGVGAEFTLVTLRKRRATPVAYPRPSAQIARRPL